MLKCPACQAQLSDVELKSARCKSCGSVLPADVAASGGDGRDTIDESRLASIEGAAASDNRQTFDESQLPVGSDSVDALERAMETVDEATIAKAVQEGDTSNRQTIDEGQLPAAEIRQTLDDSQFTAGEVRQTLDESQLPAADLRQIAATDIRQTLGDDQIAAADTRQTVDDSAISAAGPSGIGQTIDEQMLAGLEGRDLSRQTIDESQLSPPGDGMRTIDEAAMTAADRARDEGAGIAVGADDSSAAETGTVDDRDISRTINIPPERADETGTVSEFVDRTLDDEAIAAMLGGQPPKDKGTGTVNERNISRTIDIGDSPAGPPPDKGTGTVHERSIVQTLDTEAVIPLAGGVDKEEGTVTSRAVSATIDSGEISPEAAARIQATWQGQLGAGVTSMTSIKREFASESSPGSTLIIHARRFVSAKEKTQKTDADYDILQLLGEGGMGMVYAARQASIDRTVAVKTLKPDTAKDRTQRDKFLSEAVVTGDLEHPNIVPIYDVGMREDGSLFYSMKRVQGTPWMDVIHTKSLHENLEILMKVADAMGFAHDKRVIHRDLKPENVMLGGYGEVLVMDWGLAVPSDGRRIGGIKQSLSMGGTPAYMAPEMAAGPFERIGFCSDIYLLGAMLYEIITGRPPHTGEDVMKCLFAAARNQIQATEKSGELLDVALKAMATRTEDRYKTVADFQHAIREYLSHSESVALSARAAEDLQQAGKTDDYQDFAKALFGYEEAYSLWSGNERAKLGMSETALAYAGAAMRKGDFDLGVSLLKQDDPTHGELLVQLKDSIKERDARQRRLKTARRIMIGGGVAIFLIVTGASGLIYRQYGIALAAEKDALAQKAEADKQRAAAVVATNDALAQKTAADVAKNDALKQKTEADTQRAAAVAAQDVAQQRQQEAENERNEADRQRKLAEYQAYVAQIGLAAAKIEENGFDVARQLLESCDSKLRDWEWGRLMHLCQQQYETVPAAAQIDALAMSSDGKRFVTGGWNGKAQVWEIVQEARAGEDKPAQVIKPLAEIAGLAPTSFVYDVAFSPDGKLVATGGNDAGGFLRLWNAETGAEVADRFTGAGAHTDAVTSVEFSADGKWLLTGSYDATAKLWEVATGKLLNSYVYHSSWVWDASFAPVEFDEQGKALGQQRIVTASQDGTAVVWKIRWSMAEETRREHRTPPFMGHRGPIYSAAFSHDGQRVVTGGYDKRVLVWRPDAVREFDFVKVTRSEPVTPPQFEPFDGHTAAVRTVSFSHDDKLIVSGAHDNTVRIWNVETGRLHKTLRGHGSWVRDCAFMPDGQWVLSGSYDQQVMLWNIEGYNESKVLQSRALLGHADAILSANFSSDRKLIVTASRDRSAKVWNLETGETVQDLIEGHAFLATSVAYFASGKYIATGAVDNTVRIWDVATGTQSLMLDGTGRSAALALSGDGRWILTGSDDNTAKLWSVDMSLEALPADAAAAAAELKPSWIMAGHRAEVTSVAFSPDGALAVTGDSSGVCKLWDLKTQAELHELVAHTGRIMAVAFSADGKRLLTAGDSTVYQWSVATGQADPRSILKHPDTITSMALAADGNTVLTACRDGVVRQWDALRAMQVRSLDHRLIQSKTLSGDELNIVNSVVISDDGQRAMTIASMDRTIRLWELATGRELTAPGGEAPADAFLDFNLLGGIVWSAAFSHDGKRVLTVGGNSARLWEADVQPAAERRDSMTFSPHGAIASASFSADNAKIVTGSWDNSARIWDAASGKDEFKLVGQHTKQVNRAVFSKDRGLVLTASSDKTAKLWKIDWAAKTAAVLVSFEGHTDSVNDVMFSPDERFVLTASADKTARVWNAATGEQLGVLQGDMAADAMEEKKGHKWAVLRAVYSDDGKRVITGSADNTAKIWNIEDVAAPQVLFTLQGHTASVTSVAFTPDSGTRALTGSEDYTAKLWDAENGKEILTLKGHEQEVTSVAFSGDGLYALTGSRDGTAIVWLATSEGWEKKDPAAAAAEPEVRAAMLDRRAP